MQGTTKPANSTPESQSPNFNFPHWHVDEAIVNREQEVKEHFAELREWMRSVYMHWHVASVEEVRREDIASFDRGFPYLSYLGCRSGQKTSTRNLVDKTVREARGAQVAFPIRFRGCRG